MEKMKVIECLGCAMRDRTIARLEEMNRELNYKVVDLAFQKDELKAELKKKDELLLKAMAALSWSEFMDEDKENLSNEIKQLLQEPGPEIKGAVSKTAHLYGSKKAGDGKDR